MLDFIHFPVKLLILYTLVGMAFGILCMITGLQENDRQPNKKRSSDTIYIFIGLFLGFTWPCFLPLCIIGSFFGKCLRLYRHFYPRPVERTSHDES